MVSKIVSRLARVALLLTQTGFFGCFFALLVCIFLPKAAREIPFYIAFIATCLFAISFLLYLCLGTISLFLNNSLNRTRQD